MKTLTRWASISVVGRDRWIMGACLALLLLLSWLYLAALADAMDAMDDAGRESHWMWLMPMGTWGAAEFLLGFAMWAVMMVGMMLPSAIPMLFAFLSVSRTRPERSGSLGPAGAFLLGYLVVWGGYSALATAAQGLLHAGALLTPAMQSSSAVFNAVLLVAAGIYQFLPFKYACLAKCRLPLGFLLTEWRDGTRGGFIMGLRHGTYCVGCCWLLMALLFVAGVMNLLWIAMLTALVLVEKVTPFGRAAARMAGLVMAASGVWIWTH
jgi:predicted metal-binding membrane protein